MLSSSAYLTLILILVLSLCWRSSAKNLSYSYTIDYSQQTSYYGWNEVKVDILDQDAHNDYVTDKVLNHITGIGTTYFMPQPVYVSMTTISSRIEKIHQTVISLLTGKVYPTKIYVFISKEPYLLDEGISSLPDELLALAAMHAVKIVYTKNTGPHRKLLPLLSHFWKKDCFIINIDDDLGVVKDSNIIYQLVKAYSSHQRNAVIALRARRIGFCSTKPYQITKYVSWTVVLGYGNLEMLIMPTGTGGILYHPSYFHHIVFDEDFRLLTQTADDLMFRLATMVKKVPVLVGCQDRYGRSKQIIYECPKDDYDIDFEVYRTETFNHSLYFPFLDEFEDDGNDPKFAFNHTLYQESLAIVPRQLNNKTSPSSVPADLYSINRKGLNDRAWRDAIRLLAKRHVMDFRKMVENYLREREEECYYDDNEDEKRDNSSIIKKSKYQWKCAIWECRRN